MRRVNQHEFLKVLDKLGLSKEDSKPGLSDTDTNKQTVWEDKEGKYIAVATNDSVNYPYFDIAEKYLYLLEDEVPAKKEIRAEASLTVTEYTDGTAECVPVYSPEKDLTLGSHVMVDTLFTDVNNFLTSKTSQPEEENVDETSD